MSRLIDIRTSLNEALDEEMARDPTVFLIGEEVGLYNGAYKISKGLLDKYGPQRVLDTPISESAFAGLGIGAALTGLRPVVEFMSFNFSFVAADQIISNAAKMFYMSGNRFPVPIVFRGPNGAAAQVSSQHSHCVEALYSNIPGLKIVAPSNAYNAKGLLKSSIRDPNPVLFLESELSYGEKAEVPEGDYVVPLGKARVARKGKDATIVAHSRMVLLALKAAEILEKEGISIEVIDLQTIKPFDEDTIFTSVRKTHRACIVEEGHIFGGIASEVAFRIMENCFDDLDAPIERVCQKETPMPYSKVLEKATLPQVENILESIRRTL